MEHDSTNNQPNIGQQPPHYQPETPDVRRFEPPRAKRQKPQSHRHLLLGTTAGVLVGLLIAGGVYWFALRKDAKQPTADKQKTSSQTQQAAAQTIQPNSTPVAFKSTKLNIEITHRKDWTLKEDPSTGALRITSPPVSYTLADGSTKTGPFTLEIGMGVSDAAKATINGAVAPIDSLVIGYTAPTQQQRYYTNLSYAGQKNTFNFFIVTGNTALKAGSPYQYMLPLDNSMYLIVGGYGTDPNNNLTFDSMPTSAINNTVVQQALDVVKSLKIY